MQLENQIAGTPALAFTSFLSDQPAAAGDAEAVGDKISSAKAFPQIPISGVVDAILEVGNQRKALLSRLRSALKSGQRLRGTRIRPAALRIAGLKESNEKGHRTNSSEY